MPSMRRRWWLLAFAVVALAPHALAAQRAPIDSVMLPAGSVVRLRAPVLGRARETGTVHAWRRDTLLFAPLTTLGRIPVPAGTLTSLELAGGSRHTRYASAATGATLGGLLGGTAGAFVSLGHYDGGGDSENAAEPLRVGPIVIGAAVGALLGGATGWRIGPRRWTRIALP